jgi:hypothetical protein
METPMWGGSITRRDLLRSTTLFQTLNKVPEPPKDNAAASEINFTNRLTISKEKEITSKLAFLSATSDDNEKVMAVCVEEHTNKEGITIRVASNRGDLSKVVSGFKNIARILEGAARRGRHL